MTLPEDFPTKPIADADRCTASSFRAQSKGQPYGPGGFNRCVLGADGHDTHLDGFGQWFAFEPSFRVIGHTEPDRVFVPADSAYTKRTGRVPNQRFRMVPAECVEAYTQGIEDGRAQTDAVHLPSEWEYRRCLNAGEHLPTERHRAADCPVLQQADEADATRMSDEWWALRKVIESEYDRLDLTGIPEYSMDGLSRADIRNALQAVARKAAQR